MPRSVERAVRIVGVIWIVLGGTMTLAAAMGVFELPGVEVAPPLSKKASGRVAMGAGRKLPRQVDA